MLAFHSGLTYASGGFVGVDVFFVLSGYLITSLLLREIDLTGRLSLRRFYLRRARRLLPATAVVLVFSAVVVVLWTPTTQGRVFGLDILAATFYVINWRLADRSVDYLAEGVGASPVQHFWSLAVEEQFYIVWPLLVVLSLVLLRARGGAGALGRSRVSPTAVRTTLAVVVVGVGGASLVWCVATSGQTDPSTYFTTTTRLWELAVGATVAVLASRLPALSARAASVLGWSGLLAICAAALLFSTSTPWPGPATLVPTLGTAAVVVSGLGGREHSVSRLLSARVLVWLGGLSYSIYLWHWPVLVAAEGMLGRTLHPVEGIVAVLVSIVPAWATHRFVENPIRFSSRFSGDRAARRVVAVCVAAGVLAGVAASSPWARTTDALDGITPLPADATADVPESYAQGCQVDAASVEVVTCDYGDVTSDVVVVLAGDSKALQWQPALAELAVEWSWHLVTMTKSGCALSGGIQPFNDEEPYLACVRWNDAALEQVAALSPDVVITSQYANTAYALETSPLGSATGAQMQDDLTRLWGGLTAQGIQVVALLDTPTPPFEVYECVAEHPDALSRCSFDPVLPERENASVLQRAAAAAVPGVEVADLTPWICPEGWCPAVLGDVLTYRQGSHLTKTFVETLVPPLRDVLVPVVAATGAVGADG